jgi:hypothetical protein
MKKSPMLKRIERDDNDRQLPVMFRPSFWSWPLIGTGVINIAIGLMPSASDPNISFLPMHLWGGLTVLIIGLCLEPNLRKAYRHLGRSDRFPTGKSGW